MRGIVIYQRLVAGYFESVGLDSFMPVTKSQSTKAHQITSRRSRRAAALVIGLKNKNTGVSIRSRIPQNIFTLALCCFTVPLVSPSAAEDERDEDLSQPMTGRPFQYSIEETSLHNQWDGLPQKTRYKPRSPTTTGPSIIHSRASVRCRHPSSGMYPHIAATPAQANTRKIRFRFGRICNSLGISIPIQAASNPAHPPTA